MIAIKRVESPNFHKGRSGFQPIAIVNHITAGNYPGCLSWLCNPQAQSSSHYLITRAGQILQLVQDTDTAWANGIVNQPSWPLLRPGLNPNLYTLSIEHEGFPQQTLSEAQYDASLELHRLLCYKWQIPRNQQHIIGHCAIDSVDRVNCPGSAFPWQRLLTDLQRVRIFLNGVEASINAQLIDGTTFIPIRFLEKLGYIVKWDESAFAVKLEKISINKKSKV